MLRPSFIPKLFWSSLLLYAHAQAVTLTDASKWQNLFLQDKKTVIVFREDGKRLSYVKFPEMEYEVILEDNAGVYNISISPDGTKVLYNSGATNIALVDIEKGASKKILGEGVYPYWWIDPVDDKTYVTFASTDDQRKLSSDGDKYEGFTYRMELKDGSLVGTKEQLIDQAYKAGLSKDGRWLGTGNKTPAIYDIVNKEVKHLSMVEITSCFPNLSPSNDPKNMDQLSYMEDSHDIIYVRNHNDDVVWSIDLTRIMKDSGIVVGEFTSPGWSTHENFMVSSYLSFSAADKGGLLILRRDLKAGAVVAMGTHGTTAHPDMWVEGGDTWVPSSVEASYGLRTRPANSGQTGPVDILGRSLPGGSEPATLLIQNGRLHLTPGLGQTPQR